MSEELTSGHTQHRRLVALVAAFSVAILAGCATMAPPPSQGPVSAGHGVVLLSVSGNTARVGQFETVRLRPVEDNTGARSPQLLRNVASGLARDTALFVGVVPAGDYTIDRLTIDERFIALSDTSQRQLGTLRVRSGGTADLGRLVIAPVNARVVVGRSALATSNADLIRRFSPANANAVQGEVSVGWTNPRHESDRVEEYARSRPVGADTPTELPEGQVAAASRLGSVLLRDRHGRWRIASTGRLESLLALHAPAKGMADGVPTRVVAVGEFNTLARLTQEDKVQLLDSGNLPPGNLVAIYGSDQTGWVVAHQAGRRLTLYRSGRLAAGNWQPLRAEEVGSSFWSGEIRFWMWPTREGFAYAVSDGRIAHFNAVTQAFSEQRTPGGGRLASIAQSHDGALGILTVPAVDITGLFGTVYLSRDGAKSWTEVKHPFSHKVLAPSVLADGTLLLSSGWHLKRALYSSSDNGSTWTTRSETVAHTDTLVALPTLGLLAINNGARGDTPTIRHSVDGGSTWRTEYSIDGQVGRASPR